VARNRYLRIALFPFLALIFLIGWTLTYTSGKGDTKKHTQPVKNLREEILEIGLLEEVTGEIQITQSHSKTESSAA
jgi:hypothetical protein